MPVLTCATSRDPFAPPQGPDGIDRGTDGLHRRGRVVRDAHLGQAKRQRAAEPQHDPPWSHLVERADRHGDQHRVAGEWVDRTQGHADVGDLGGDGRGVAHGVALEVGVVDPHGVQALSAARVRPPDDVRDLAPSGEAQPGGTDQLGHGARATCGPTGHPRHRRILRPGRECAVEKDHAASSTHEIDQLLGLRRFQGNIARSDDHLCALGVGSTEVRDDLELEVMGQVQRVQERSGGVLVVVLTAGQHGEQRDPGSRHRPKGTGR